MKRDKEEINELRARIEHLEENRRYILNALEMALSIGDFQSEIERRATAVDVFHEAEKRLSRLMNFQVLAFYRVDPESSDFTLTCLTPDSSRNQVEKEMNFMIEKGIVAWAIREKRGVIVPSEDHSQQVLLHVIATNSQIRGMFAGVLTPEKDAIPDISLELLSIILRNAANALENIELLKTIASERTLKKSKEYIESVLLSIPTGIMIVDAETHRILGVNPQAQALIGLTSDEITGEECYHHFSSCEKNKCPITDLKKPIHHKETGLLTKDGGTIPILKTAVQTIIGGQNCLIESLVDISEQKKAEEFRTEHDKLKAAIEITGTICHEMNQPLMIISGLSELIMTSAGDEVRRHDYIAKIKEQVDRLGKITFKLQNIGKYATKPYLKGEIVDLDRAADQ